MGLESVFRVVYRVLVELGYSPVVVGTYALILQGWLPSGFIDETKDVDVYVDEPMVVFDDRVEEKLLCLGFAVGRSEAGGFYVDAAKPVEILYPLYDFYIPKPLLKHTVHVDCMNVLEGHAVLVSKALGSSIKYLASSIKAMGVSVDTSKLYLLLKSISSEIEVSKYRVALKRIDDFVREFLKTLEKGGVTGFEG